MTVLILTGALLGLELALLTWLVLIGLVGLGGFVCDAVRRSETNPPSPRPPEDEFEDRWSR